MKLLPTIDRAKNKITDYEQKILKLESYIDLVENYNEHSLQQKVLKTYALTGSIQKVVAEINTTQISANLDLIDSDFVIDIIKGKPEDELHKLLKRNYMLKNKAKWKK